MDNFVHNVVSIPRLKIFSRRVAIFAIFVGSIVLVGWFLDINSLKVLVPGLASMKANTALCLVLCGVSLSLMGRAGSSQTSYDKRARIAGGFLALVAVSAALATLAEYVLRRSFAIDEILFVDHLGDGHSIPGRMAPHTALCFALLGAALAFI